MRKIYNTRIFLCAFFVIALAFSSRAQCPAGTTTASVNWDNLDYLPLTGTYTSFVPAAMSQTQKFALGLKHVTIYYPSTISTLGDNALNTAEGGAFSTGADVEYSGNGAITITFDTLVRNVQFSLFDIDSRQEVRVTAQDDAAVPVALNVNMAVVTTGIITVTGSGTTAPAAVSVNTATAANDSRGSLNVSISGTSPVSASGVKRITITVSGTAGNFHLGDITACVSGAFPLNYYASQQPWIGQPSYYLVTPDNNSVYMMNPLTGVCQWMFSEPSSPWVNSMAYDPINRVLYYVMDNPTPVSTNKVLKKYDFNTETISVVIADITTLGIPTFDIVVESAGAAFYNGSLFLGIEGANSAKTSNREAIVWRIDFDAALNPVNAAQVFARPADNGGGTLTHDWGDFIIRDGVLYDFNTGNGGSTAQFVHHNMMTGISTNFNTSGNPTPIQSGQTWDGALWWTGGQGSETGRVARYNENGTIGTKIVATVTVCSPSWVGRAGDASDPFKPKSDFGDAPASYDPIAQDKATHEYDCNLRLGATYDREWDKTSSVDATTDGTDEDGIATVTVLSSGVVNYVQEVQVFNNTGANATLSGWLDYDGDGVFEAVEAKLVTVPSSASMQTITLAWMGIPVGLPAGTSTFMRVRLTSAANGMTESNPTRWYPNGEVEDYRVYVDVSLPVQVLSFTAVADGNDKSVLTWKSGDEINFTGYDVERSADGQQWSRVAFVAGKHSATNHYRFTDHVSVNGKMYYRLKLLSTDNSYQYSDVRVVESSESKTWIRVDPNPVRDYALLQFRLTGKETVTVQVSDASGKKLVQRTVSGVAGLNQVPMNEWAAIAPGIYFVQVITANDILSTKVLVRK
jgi:hypothetical protein